MDLEMVLNELSLQPPAKDIRAARLRMADFVDAVRAAKKKGIKALRTHDDLSYVALAPDYPFARWRNDTEVDRDTRLFFKTLITKAPYLKDITNPTIEDRVGRSEFFYQGDQAAGLGAASLLDALALSLRSGPRWEASRLELEVKLLDEFANLVTEQAEIMHASCSDHIQEHASWIESRIQIETRIGILDGVDLWNRKTALFPNLQFCASVGEQLQSLRSVISCYSPSLRGYLSLRNFAMIGKKVLSIPPTFHAKFLLKVWQHWTDIAGSEPLFVLMVRSGFSVGMFGLHREHGAFTFFPL